MRLLDTLSELEDKHKGLPVAVIGGGELPNDLDLSGHIVIGCNHHYDDPDYLVYTDRPIYVRQLKKALDKFMGISIGRYEYRNHPEYGVPNKKLKQIKARDTGDLAIWLAKYMGGNPIKLFGFDKKIKQLSAGGK